MKRKGDETERMNYMVDFHNRIAMEIPGAVGVCVGLAHSAALTVSATKPGLMSL